MHASLRMSRRSNIRQSSVEPAPRLMRIRGIGATTALALVARVGSAHEFKNGRQFSAWIGLVPRQFSTGGKPRLGHISKLGDPYVRGLLLQGARAVLNTAASHQYRFSHWVLELQLAAAITARW
jgi:transposase